jgi:hypothetical protein
MFTCVYCSQKKKIESEWLIDSDDVCKSCSVSRKYFEDLDTKNALLLAEAEALLASYKRKKNIHTYFLTLTTDPEKRVTLADLKKYCYNFVARKGVLEWGGCIEHIDSNMHAHIMFKYNGSFRRHYLSAYSRNFGHFQLRRVTVDNGIQKYIEKLEEEKKMIL